MEWEDRGKVRPVGDFAVPTLTRTTVFTPPPMVRQLHCSYVWLAVAAALRLSEAVPA